MSDENDDLSRFERQYVPLTAHLRGDESPSVVMEFAEVESILGRMLPRAARTDQQWWESRSRRPHARSWMLANRIARADLAVQLVTFVRPVFDHSADLDATKKRKQMELRYAREQLCYSPREDHIARRWWEPREVYLVRSAGSRRFKIGQTRVGTRRVREIAGPGGQIIDRLTVANHWAAVIVECQVLELVWDAWGSPGQLDVDEGLTERWSDWLEVPPLSTVRDRLHDDLLLPGWDRTISREGA